MNSRDKLMDKKRFSEFNKLQKMLKTIFLEYLQKSKQAIKQHKIRN